MIKELDIVTLTHDIGEYKLPKGSLGAVVHCYNDGKGFEVEFIDKIAETSYLLTLERKDIQLERSNIQAQVIEIMGDLPEDLLVEVRDFVEFLQQKQQHKAG